MKEKVSEKDSWLALIPVGMGLFMVLLDASVLRVALPKITQDFHATMSDVQWISNSYTLTMVSLLVLAGRIGDVVRRDKYFISAMAIFTFSSFLCAQAWNVASLIFFRAIQAVGGAMLSSNVLAIITELFPPGKRGMAMGINSVMTASSFTLGPIIGGWLTTNLSWHWVFYINVPVGIISIILASTLLPPLEAKERVPIDFSGAVLLGISLALITLGITNGRVWGWWSRKTIACFIVSIPYAFAFLIRELNCDYPILDLSLFKVRNFSVSILAISILFFGLSASLFVLPYFLQGIKSLTAEESGYWMVSIPLLNTLFAPLAGRLSDEINPKYLMCLGPLFFALSLHFLRNVGIDVNYWTFFFELIPMGIGMGLLMSPSYNVMMGSVPREKVGMANGTVRSINTLSQAMGVAVGGVLIANRMDELTGYGNFLPDPGTMNLLKVMTKSNPLPLISLVSGFVDSMHYVFSIVVWLPIVSSIMILLLVE